LDHALLALNLHRQLQYETTPPDVAFIGYPPIEAAAVMTRWLNVRGIPSLLDVKDQWPSIFIEALPKLLRPLGHVALSPYFHLAKRTMRDATGISAMADSFLDRTLFLAKRKRSSQDGVFPLAPSNNSVSAEALFESYKWWEKFDIQKFGTLRISYVGNLSPNVDLAPVKLAASYFLSKNIPVEFYICGDGVSLKKYKEMMMDLSNVHFPGRIGQAQALAITQQSHASLIPYVNNENFQLSLPNKSIDSLAFGLPILSSLQGEVGNLIEKHNVGLRYGTDSKMSLIECIEKLIEAPCVRQEMSKNALNLYTKKFSYDIVYGGLVRHLESLFIVSKKESQRRLSSESLE
jgi:glycosyltransferase involved in cell wall biosynthesis